MIYISAPYSHDSKDVIEYRAKVVQKYFEHLSLKGVVSITPIIVGHVLHGRESFSKIPYEFWMNMTNEYLKYSSELHVIKLRGWDKSNGVKVEIDFALKNKIPIRYIEESEIK